MKLKCPKCGHQWNYKGKSDYYVTCPFCYRKIRIKKTDKELIIATEELLQK